MEDLTQFDLARSFSKAGSIFKASASGNLAAGAVPEAKVAGLFAGIGATIPPVFARSTQILQGARGGLIRGSQTTAGRFGQTAILRKLLESQGAT